VVENSKCDTVFDFIAHSDTHSEGEGEGEGEGETEGEGEGEGEGEARGQCASPGRVVQQIVGGDRAAVVLLPEPAAPGVGERGSDWAARQGAGAGQVSDEAFVDQLLGL
jgi:hypothetical protein